MRKKVIRLAVVAVMLSAAAILYRTLQPNTYRIEDILAVYQSAKGRLTAEHEDYNDITIEYPLNETLFPPEMVPPVYRWNDSVTASKSWLIRFEFADGKPCMNFPAQRQHWTPRPEDWENIKHRSLEQEAKVIILGVGAGEPVRVLSQARMSFKTSKD
ncbi:MAG: hypothetical protein HQ580_01485, partial [Planctomycetes bacterium]|nr:hypothetical protein [Planctomycetota bacterium]